MSLDILQELAREEREREAQFTEYFNNSEDREEVLKLYGNDKPFRSKEIKIFDWTVKRCPCVITRVNGAFGPLFKDWCKSYVAYCVKWDTETNKAKIGLIVRADIANIETFDFDFYQKDIYNKFLKTVYDKKKQYVINVTPLSIVFDEFTTDHKKKIIVFGDSISMTPSRMSKIA